MTDLSKKCQKPGINFLVLFDEKDNLTLINFLGNDKKNHFCVGVAQTIFFDATFVKEVSLF